MEFSARDFFETLGVTFAALFPIVNPLGCAPIFFGLTHNYPQSAQRILAHKIAAYGFALLLISALFGSEILAFFGISLFVVQIAGGLVVAVAGWNLLNQPEDQFFGKPCTGNAPGRARSCLFPADPPAHGGSGQHFHRNHARSSSQISGRPGLRPWLSSPLFRGRHRHVSRLRAGNGVLRQCRAPCPDAGQVRDQCSNPPLCLYPAGDRRPNPMEWSEHRHTPDPGADDRALTYLCPKKRDQRVGVDSAARMEKTGRALSWV